MRKCPVTSETQLELESPRGLMYAVIPLSGPFTDTQQITPAVHWLLVHAAHTSWIYTEFPLGYNTTESRFPVVRSRERTPYPEDYLRSK